MKILPIPILPIPIGGFAAGLPGGCFAVFRNLCDAHDRTTSEMAYDPVDAGSCFCKAGSFAKRGTVVYLLMAQLGR